MTLKERLEKASTLTVTIVAALAGFCAYFSMYAFRKPFTAITYDNVVGWDLDLKFKIALVIAQVVGYATSKMIGIKVISEMPAVKRGKAIIGLMVAAWIALVLFAVLPTNLKVGAMFLNGLPLGMIWGLVFGYMEGRRTSEVLGAVLCASFILSSGVVKSVGLLTIAYLAVPPLWMPAVTAAFFFPLLILSVWVLVSLPGPTAEDEAARVRRAPMNRQQRLEFMAQYGIGILALVVVYMFATALRDLRDNFAIELWTSLGYANPAGLFTASEIPVALCSLFTMGIIILIHDNIKALGIIHALIGGGLVLLGIATFAFDIGMISPIVWMIIAGAGLYVAYTPFNAMLFDRLVAVSNRVATAGFLIYVADSAGYASSVALVLWRNFGTTNLSWLNLFRIACYTTAVSGGILCLLAWIYFSRRTRVSV